MGAFVGVPISRCIRCITFSSLRVYVGAPLLMGTKILYIYVPQAVRVILRACHVYNKIRAELSMSGSSVQDIVSCVVGQRGICRDRGIATATQAMRLPGNTLGNI